MDSSPLNLFYSYSHKDKEQRQELDKHLSMLVRNKVINQWYDGQITAGSLWESTILEHLKNADIVLFLVTANWLNSTACIEEWEEAKKLQKSQPNKRLIPIIAVDCAWQDFDDMASMLVLPSDGKAVSQWRPKDSAWNNIYAGIKSAATEIKKNFMIKPTFHDDLESIEFCSTSSSEIKVHDVFVFPNLVRYQNKNNSVEEKIDGFDTLVKQKHQFIHGESQSGKTKLLSWLYLEFKNKKIPCIYVDFNQFSNDKNKLNILNKQFEIQQTGSFNEWLKQDDKVILFDNLSKEKKCIELIKFSESNFDKIIVCSSSDNFRSYYIDDERFSDYQETQIKPFCHSKQEQLISNWVKIKSKCEDVDHNLIDSLENNINSIIIDNKVLPRYPFFILSILQTYESFMPENLKITAYGHCYHALILARLIKTGINQEDSALESAFSFCSNLAFRIFKKGNNSHITEDEFNEFYELYSNEYIIKGSVRNRLFSEYGLLERKNGKVRFCISYTYYYFLGKYLTENYSDNKSAVSSMIESSYARHNSLILIFTIHHANDIGIIDEILTHTLCAIDDKKPAPLDKDETSIFNLLLDNILPEKFEQSGSVIEEREREREIRTEFENKKNEPIDDSLESLASENKLLNQIFQCNKNIEILSQILKNKTGSLKKTKLSEIVEIICDAGLRMASVMLDDQKEIDVCADFIYKQYLESDEYDDTKSHSYHLNEIRQILIFRVMIWVLNSVEKSIQAINKPELKYIVFEISEKKSTPAYHIIRYFYLLDTCSNFDSELKKQLEFVTKKYNKNEHPFINRMISIRTQHYESTHRIKESYRQAIFSTLKIGYKKPKVIKKVPETH